jgi:hypothetical protein
MEKEITEAKEQTRSVDDERVSPEPVSERKSSEHLPVSMQVKEAVASSSSTPSSTTDSDHDENTAQVSPGEAKPR